MEQKIPGNAETSEAFTALEQGMEAALATYSNVHRGSGHNSVVTTHLYEQARKIVLEYLDLANGKYVVIFCTAHRAAALMSLLKPGSYQCVSSKDFGLSLGVQALAVDRKALPEGAPFQSGGGTTRLISPGWIVWADAPDRFEAGTPAIINVILFAKALQLIRSAGKEIFRDPAPAGLPAIDILHHDELEEFSGQDLLDKLRQTMVGRDVRVPTMEGSRPFINLDNSASTPTFRPVWDTVSRVLSQPLQVQVEVIQEVKTICLGFLGAPAADYDVIFTSNTTEAINLAAESLGREPAIDIEPVVLSTIMEHSSNDLPWRLVSGYFHIVLPVDAEGFVDQAGLETILCAHNDEGQYGRKRIRLVAVSGASNVLGTCNDLAEISRIVHRYGARLLVDAAQLVAHRKVDIQGSGIDYLAFSAHKVYAPFGTGALVVRKGLLHFSPAEMELIRSSGEENAAGIAALGKALVLMQRIGMEVIREEEQALTARLLTGLAQITGLTIFGIRDPDSPRFARKAGVIVFGMKGMMANRVAEELALQGGIGTRYGCHCAHILIKHLLGVPPLLQRFQRLIVTVFPGVRLPGLTRVSLGIENTAADVDTLIRVLGNIAGKNMHKTKSQSTQEPSFKHKQTKAVVKKQMDDFAKDVALKVYSKK